MFLLIDNYDSSAYNLKQAFQILGHQPVIRKNDDPGILDLAESNTLSRVCLSAGPGRPEDAGLVLEFMEKLDNANPGIQVLGVGLGHQILAQYGGGDVLPAPRPMHGKASMIRHDGQGLFHGLPEPFEAGRYNSLLARPRSGCRFEVTARTVMAEDDEAGAVMSLKFTDRPWSGVQFSPESVLTPKGLELLANFFSSGEKKAESASTALEETPTPMPVLMETIARLCDLDQESAAQVFTRLMDGELHHSQAGALLLGLRAKGETPVEMAEAAAAVLAKAVPLPPLPGPVLDIVGTGGDGRNSFNCSTATALIMAGLGYKVVKHGNRSISSRSGSADVLELMGTDLAMPPEQVPQELLQRNFAFLFAPNYHPSFRHIMPVRKELGIRTLFNILGPLVNPARPEYSFLGAPNLETLPLMAGALARLGTRFSAIVHGFGGYDEVTTMGPSSVFLVAGKKISQMTIDPARYGFHPCRPEELAISGPDEGVAVLRELLNGQGPAPMRDMLILNVAMALFVRRGGHDFDDCVTQARAAVRDGVGRDVLAPKFN